MQFAGNTHSAVSVVSFGPSVKIGLSTSRRVTIFFGVTNVNPPAVDRVKNGSLHSM
jgi:hypothetical protein